MKKKILYIYLLLYPKQKNSSVLPNYGRHRISSFQVFEEYFEEHEKFDSHQNLRDLLVQVSHFTDEKHESQGKVNCLFQDRITN